VRGAIVRTLEQTTLADLLLGPAPGERPPLVALAERGPIAPASVGALEADEPKPRSLASGA
jgi:hypothetical protein